MININPEDFIIKPYKIVNKHKGFFKTIPPELEPDIPTDHKESIEPSIDLEKELNILEERQEKVFNQEAGHIAIKYSILANQLETIRTMLGNIGDDIYKINIRLNEITNKQKNNNDRRQ